jgi:3-deoxy-D-manno-octulosonic-acid transferase
MSLFIYNFFVRIYASIIYVFSFFNSKAKLLVEGRKNTWHILRKGLEGNTAPIAWFHCASLGEFEQGRPVIEAFKISHAHYKILLTFFSPSGYTVRKDYEFADITCYLPMDCKKNAKKFVTTAKPAIAFFVKYEFWYHYISELYQKDIPTISFSAIFRKEQVFFKSYGQIFRQILQRFDHIFVQNQVSVDLLKDIGIVHTSVCGDTRFDRVWTIRTTKKEIIAVKQFKGNHFAMVVGSSWNEDISIIAEAFRDLPPTLKLIIAPHEISENNLQFIENQFTMQRTIRFSQIANIDISLPTILLIDNVGMLSALYQYADFAFVGGGFRQGLHNILEPAVFGMPIFFGNQAYQKFNEALFLEKKGVAFPIANSSKLRELFLQLLENKEETKQIAENCIGFVEENLGASEKILAYVGLRLGHQ